MKVTSRQVTRDWVLFLEKKTIEALRVTSILRLISVICLLVFVNETRASDISIYVSPKGKGNGTVNSPASLDMAFRKLPMLKKTNPTGTIFIILKDGEYYLEKPLEITPELSGTEALKICFKADLNAHPIIKGSKRILLEGKGDLAAAIKPLNNVPFYDLYVNSERAVRAREPNCGQFSALEKVTKKSERLDSSSKGKSTLYTTEYTLPKPLFDKIATLPDSQLRKIRYRYYFLWATEERTIDSIDRAHHSFYSTGTKIRLDGRGGTEIYLENFPQAFDSANEWIVDKDSIRYKAKNEQGRVMAEVPVLEKLLVIRGDSMHPVTNISFENIAFQYSNHVFEKAEHTQAAALVGAAIAVDYARKIDFINCEIAHTGEYGIWLREGVKDCAVRHCYIHDLGAGGVRIGELVVRDKPEQATAGNKVINCIIQSGGYNFPAAVGVFIAQSGNNLVEHNDIADFRYSGISAGWIWGYAYSPSVNNAISFNHIHHLGWAVLSDMAGIYTLGVSDGTLVSNNVIHDVYSKIYGGWGLYTDEGSTGIVMRNNLVYNTKTGAFHQHYGENNVIENNIFCFGLKYQVQFTRVENHKSFDFKHNFVLAVQGDFLQGPWAKGNIDLDSNCYWNMGDASLPFIDSLNLNSWKLKSGKDLHSIWEDPRFVDAQHFDFKLKNLDAATKIGFVPFDYTKAGVYGSKQWTDLARLPKAVLTAFDESVKANMEP